MPVRLAAAKGAVSTILGCRFIKGQTLIRSPLKTEPSPNVFEIKGQTLTRWSLQTNRSPNVVNTQGQTLSESVSSPRF